MIYRVTFGFDGQGTGWAETHACYSAAERPELLFGFLDDIANKRAQFLGKEFRIKAIRVSRYATDAGVRARGARMLKGEWRNAVTAAAAASEPSSVALIAVGTATPNQSAPQFDTNTNRMFLGGPLDVSVTNAGIVQRDKGGLGAAYDSWAATMVQKDMGWLASDTIKNIGITTITQAPNGTVLLAVPEAEVADLPMQGVYKVRVREVNNGRSPLNMEMIVRKTAAGILTTARVIGIPTTQAGGSIRIYKPVSPFVNYATLDLQGEVGKHQRGRPFGSQPGREKDRILG